MSYWAYENQDCDYYREDEKSHYEQELEKKLENVTDFFEGVLDQLYGKEEFDKSHLENCLDEIANSLDVKMRTEDLVVERINDSVKTIAHFLSNCPL